MPRFPRGGHDGGDRGVSATWIAEDKLCILCRHILRRERTVVAIAHEHDGRVIFSCGERDHDGVTDWATGHAKHVIAQHPRVRSVESLPVGHQLEWKDGAGWTLYAIPEEDGEGA